MTSSWRAGPPPTFVVSCELPLDAPPEAYDHLGRREESTVVLKPGLHAA